MKKNIYLFLMPMKIKSLPQISSIQEQERSYHDFCFLFWEKLLEYYKFL